MYWVGAGILQGEGAILGTCPRSPGDIRNIQRELKLFAGSRCVAIRCQYCSSLLEHHQTAAVLAVSHTHHTSPVGIKCGGDERER